MSLNDGERENAPRILLAAGVRVPPEMIALWDDQQVAHALVWADSAMEGRPIDKPRHLDGAGYDGELRLTSAIRGRTIERFEGDDQEIVLWFDRGGGLAIRLDGD